ncbi:MAG TPA: hypothetical protein VLW55_23405, partial [Burkholderiaceae bacterium]|nr:hypothetical protein [Burkholderiaceae bacterium]
MTQDPCQKRLAYRIRDTSGNAVYPIKVLHANAVNDSQSARWNFLPIEGKSYGPVRLRFAARGALGLRFPALPSKLRA